MAARGGSGIREVNERLERLEQKMTTSSKIFELMDQRLEHLEEGQGRVVDRLDRLIDATVRDRTAMIEQQQILAAGIERLTAGQERLAEGQERVVERLDRLVEATTRDRTHFIERLARLEKRVDDIERRF